MQKPKPLHCSMMQRRFFLCSPRFTSLLASPQTACHAEQSCYSQLVLSPLFQWDPSCRRHPHQSSWSGGAYWWHRHLTWGVPLYTDHRVLTPPSGNLEFASMSRSGSKSPKRARHPSGGCQSKVQKTQDRDPQSRLAARSGEAMCTSGKGFRQTDWPRSIQECEWRRAGTAFQSAQATTASRPSSSSESMLHCQRIAHRLSDGLRPGFQNLRGHVDKGTQSNVAGKTAFCQTATNLRVQNPAACQRFLSSASSEQSQPPRNESGQRYAERSVHDVPQRRQWSSARPFEFSVLSYNILAQSLLESNRHLYEHCQEDVLPWDYRRYNLLEEIKKSDADVICLQEVESEHFYDFFQPQLTSLGYDVVYKKRTGDKTDGCATFFKRARFQLVVHSRLEYQRSKNCLDRDNVAVIVMLQPQGLPRTHQLCVANTHLLWNPRRGDVKLAQLALLFAELEHMCHVDTPASEPDIYHPIVLCGDFNSLPHCPLYTFVKKGHMTYEGVTLVDVSGQVNSRGKYLKRHLWPKEIGVTPRCRYVHRDMTMEGANSDDLHVEQADCYPSVHANNNAAQSTESDHQSDPQNLPPPPDLVHPFFFSSVYEHADGNQEVTTNHSRTNCVVDYIFYTRNVPRGRSKRSGADAGSRGHPGFTSDLAMTRRLNLFTDTEVESMGGLPNARWSSDHLSLHARFCMTPVRR